MPKNLRKRGKVWWYRIHHKGREHEGSLQTESLTVARERLESIRRRLTDKAYGLERRTFDEAARRFGAEHFKVLKRKSRLRYVVSITNLEQHLKGLTLDMITTARLSEIEQARLASGVTSATVRRDLACLSSIFTRCEEWGWTTSNPVKPYLRSRKSALREAEPRVSYWTTEEEAKALLHAPPKAREAIAFAIDTGLRKEEQFSLLWTDVDLVAGQLTVRAEVSKTGKARTIPILPRTLEALRARAQPFGFVFTASDGSRYTPNSPTMWEALGKACRRAGLPRIAWHDLRRTCGIRLLRDHKLRMEEVSRWLGHSSVRVTERHYAFLSVDDLHRAVARSPVVVFLKRNNAGN